MKTWFVTYRTDAGKKILEFLNIEKLFGWLQEYLAEHGHYPNEMLVFLADCKFDGSF